MVIRIGWARSFSVLRPPARVCARRRVGDCRGEKKMKLLPALLLTLSAVLAGCESSSRPAPDATAACTCGTPMAAFEGCAHPLCIQGKTNPDNPECVCGRLELEEEGGAQ